MVLGVFIGLFANQTMSPLRLGITGGFILVAALVYEYAVGQRRAADRMEHYWFRLREARLDMPPAGQSRSAEGAE